jgi:S-adenosylmethionine hydrolase
MSPVAAHLARGAAAAELGPPCTSLVQLDWPQPRKTTDQVIGEILLTDSFGNLITNIDERDVAALAPSASLAVDCGGHEIRGIVPTYGAAMEGELVALFDSQGRLEIAKVGGSARAELRIEAGEQVIVYQP